MSVLSPCGVKIAKCSTNLPWENKTNITNKEVNITNKALEIILTMTKSNIYSINIIVCHLTSGTVMIGDW